MSEPRLPSKLELAKQLIDANNALIEKNKEIIHHIRYTHIIMDYISQMLNETAMQPDDDKFANWMLDTILAMQRDLKAHRETKPT